MDLKQAFILGLEGKTPSGLSGVTLREYLKGQETAKQLKELYDRNTQFCAKKNSPRMVLRK
jgi:hypothetical protein